MGKTKTGSVVEVDPLIDCSRNEFEITEEVIDEGVIFLREEEVQSDSMRISFQLNYTSLFRG